MADDTVRCCCGRAAILRTSWTDLKPARRFYGCKIYGKSGGCNFFTWYDPPMCDRSTTVIPGLLRKSWKFEAEIADLKRKDEKLQDVLGHFQKDFEGGVSAENLGAKFGGYGSFLPTYQRSPSWFHPRTPSEVYNRRSRFPNNMHPENFPVSFYYLMDQKLQHASSDHPRLSSNMPPLAGKILNADAASGIREDWVCCHKCQAWRLLPLGTNPKNLPANWLCSMLNWLPGMNHCGVSEKETTNALRALYQTQASTAETHNQYAHLVQNMSLVPSYGDQILSEPDYQSSGHNMSLDPFSEDDSLSSSSSVKNYQVCPKRSSFIFSSDDRYLKDAYEILGNAKGK